MNSSPSDICAACQKPIGRGEVAVEVVDMFSSNNQTVGQWLAPQIDQVYLSGKMPPLLPGAQS